MCSWQIREVKTEASGKPVPLHRLVYDMLLSWRLVTAYGGEGDFLFPSERLNGKKPLTPDMVLRKIIRPALVRASVQGKVIGWHSFRHSLATNLRSLGVDVKVAQELLRHANSRITNGPLHPGCFSGQAHSQWEAGRVVNGWEERWYIILVPLCTVGDLLVT